MTILHSDFQRGFARAEEFRVGYSAAVMDRPAEDCSRLGNDCSLGESRPQADEAAIGLNFQKSGDEHFLVSIKGHADPVARLHHPQLDAFAVQMNGAVRRHVENFRAG
jgi:hypothetical protein